MITRNKKKQLQVSEEHLQSSRGDLDHLPYHVRMQIYTDAPKEILQVCKGIYAEARQTLVDQRLVDKALNVVGGTDSYRPYARVWTGKGKRLGLFFSKRRHFNFNTKGNEYLKPDTWILNRMTIFSLRIDVDDHYKESILPMLREITKELKMVTTIRIGSLGDWAPCGSIRWGSNDLGDLFPSFVIDWYRQVFEIVLTLPTIKRIIFSGYSHGPQFSRGERVRKVKQILIELEIPFREEDGEVHTIHLRRGR